MLRSNLWTEKGLVNGAVGHIVHILYEEGSDPAKDPPAALVCTFDNYTGPYLDDSRKTVVISAITRQWTSKKGTDCVRIQFPVALCYACTIHKSQGLSLEKVFMNIGALREKASGQTYTALSRVTSLEGLLLEPFGKKRLLSINDKPYIPLRRSWEDELSRKDISYLFR
ncbi:hypothetical protein ONE63_011560 [Megalurothrips usitatus]|uniref:ATP-dependent DNA helicase n=1 Tax=Megalurothrips usitatus TaxID=439358 RepID=A0AAV7X328_9NEOP|nr:hypothetical protein ONE63_011560 [Megalurothrips usitatus]